MDVFLFRTQLLWSEYIFDGEQSTARAIGRPNGDKNKKQNNNDDDDDNNVNGAVWTWWKTDRLTGCGR